MNTSLPVANFREWITRQSQPLAGMATRVLGKRETAARNLRTGQAVQCLKGVIWVTLEGEAGDVVLRAGERHVPAKPGRVVVEALEGASAVRW